MLQRLPIALGWVNTGNNLENILNEPSKAFIIFINQKKPLINKYTIM